jgi:hypothetical protein
MYNSWMHEKWETPHFGVRKNGTFFYEINGIRPREERKREEGDQTADCLIRQFLV